MHGTMTAIHPEARKRIDARAGELLARLPADPPNQPVGLRSSFVPDRPIAGTFTDEDIAGPVHQWQRDADGQEIGCIAATPEGFVAFNGDHYNELIALAQAIHRTPAMRESVSLESIKTWTLDWALAKRLSRDPGTLSSYILRQREAAIAPYKIIVPIYEPFIQEAFSIGSVLLTPLKRSDVETWFATPESVPGDHRARAEEVMASRRRLLQGRTAAVVSLHAERSYATSVALEKATLVTAMLRLMSKGMFFPTVRSNCVLLGLEVTERHQVIEFKDDALLGMSEWLLDPESLGHWALDSRMIDEDRRYWDLLGELAERQEPSEFERDLLNAVLLYSRVALSRDVSEKLIHLFAAVESILLRNDTEPIQSAISERLAFVVGATPDGRADVARLVKSVYGLRSKFVHHGARASDQKDLLLIKKLLVEVWKFFFQLTLAKGSFPTRAAFLDSLERRKWQ
jgi:hypothetical protein